MDVEEYTMDEPEDEPRSRRMEMLAGIILVVVVIGFVLFNYIKGEMQVSHYHAGTDAMSGGDLDLAVAELQSADGYLDSNTLIEDARSKIKDRDALYKEASDFAIVGKWWQVSRKIIEMQDVQKTYKDSDALLAHAREINGPLFFTHLPTSGRLDDGTPYSLTGTVDLNGVFSMQADGKQADQIPNTVRELQTYALSPDGQSLVYSIPNSSPRLYNFKQGWITQLTLPGAGQLDAVQKAVFSPDGSSLAIVTADKAYIFDMSTVLTKGESRDPVNIVSRDDFEKSRVKMLILDKPSDEVTSVAIRAYVIDKPLTANENLGPTPSAFTADHVIALEHGRIDGAIFSKDQHYLMYRVCVLTNGNKNFDCALKLADLTNFDADPRTIADIPNLSLSSYDDALTGEFTRDGEHYIVTTNYRRYSETVLYNIKTGEANKLNPATFEVTTGRDKDDVYVSGADYLIDDYMPGLEEWQGRNSLARTSQTILRPTDRFARVKSHWVTVSSNGRFVLALSSHITESTRYYRLATTNLTWNSTDAPNEPRTLFSTKSLPREWLPSMKMLADGYTLIVSTAGDADPLPGVYAYSLDDDLESNVQLVENSRLVETYSFPNAK